MTSERKLRDRDHTWSGMHKCPYCRRWECSCCAPVTEGGPDDEIFALQQRLDAAAATPSLSASLTGIQTSSGQVPLTTATYGKYANAQNFHNEDVKNFHDEDAAAASEGATDEL